MGLGTLDDPDSPAIRIIDPATNTFFEVPFGRNPLTDGRSFVCGDSVIFLVTQDPTLPGGVRVSVGRIDGGTQIGPFTGRDTFENLENIVFLPDE